MLCRCLLSFGSHLISLLGTGFVPIILPALWRAVVAHNIHKLTSNLKRRLETDAIEQKRLDLQRMEERAFRTQYYLPALGLDGLNEQHYANGNIVTRVDVALVNARRTWTGENKQHCRGGGNTTRTDDIESPGTLCLALPP